MPNPDAMEFHAWAERFQPVPNHLDASASFNGLMFETYGSELEWVNASDHAHVWTFMESEGVGLIVPGRWFVNRLGYFVCRVPFDDECRIEVKVFDDADREDCLECGIAFVSKEDNVAGFCRRCDAALRGD